MIIHSYKHYLLLIEKKPRLSALQKTAGLIFATLLITLGILSALFYYQYQKEAPQRHKKQYLEIASTGFVSTAQSIEELIQIFQVAGVKIQILKNQSETSSEFQTGFFSTLDDLSRLISKLESSHQNLTNQKSLLKSQQPPQDLQEINQDLLNYDQQTLAVIENTKKDYQFLKDLILALGPNYYLPQLSDESLWKEGSEKEIITHFETLKSEADQALASLSRLNAPEEFTDHLKIQTKYLELLVTTSSKIVEILTKQAVVKEDEATPLEEAYQILTKAKEENNSLAMTIFSQRQNLFSPQRNLDRFASVRLLQYSLQTKLQEASTNQIQKDFTPFTILYEKLLQLNERR